MSAFSMASSSASVFRRAFSTSSPSLIGTRYGGNGRLRSRAAAARRKAARIYEGNRYRPLPGSGTSQAGPSAGIQKKLAALSEQDVDLSQRMTAAQTQRDQFDTSAGYEEQSEANQAYEKLEVQHKAVKREKKVLEQTLAAQALVTDLRHATEERLQSAHRLKPLKMQQRDVRNPPTPRISLAPLADPHLVDPKNINPDPRPLDHVRKQKIAKIIKSTPNRSTARQKVLKVLAEEETAYSKQLPLKYEQKFLELQKQGLFLGPDTAARADFLSALSRYRYRVRGIKLGKPADGYDAQTEQWMEKNKIFGRTPHSSWYRFFKEIDDEQKPFRTAHVDTSYDLGPAPEMQTPEIDGDPDEEPAEQSSAGGTALSVTQRRMKAASQGLADPLSQDGVKVVGQRIYLPNIGVRLLRNRCRSFPVKEPYDPWIATFQLPLGMTKTDLRSYLMAVYGLPVSFIRTWIWRNSHARVWRRGSFKYAHRTARGAGLARQKGSLHNKKLAIVGLYEPFHYPDDVEELYAQGFKWGVGEQLGNERNAWLMNKFNVLFSPMETRRMQQQQQGIQDRVAERREGEYKSKHMLRETSGPVQKIKVSPPHVYACRDLADIRRTTC